MHLWIAHRGRSLLISTALLVMLCQCGVLRWHFTNKSITGAPNSIKSYSLSHSWTLWWRVLWLKQCRLEVAAELQLYWTFSVNPASRFSQYWRKSVSYDDRFKTYVWCTKHRTIILRYTDNNFWMLPTTISVKIISNQTKTETLLLLLFSISLQYS